jgi:hypothetical protein
MAGIDKPGTMPVAETPKAQGGEIDEVRLFVGGLPGDVTEPLLSSRFTPFGHVVACEIVAPKQSVVMMAQAAGLQPAQPRLSGPSTSTDAAPGSPELSCRGFAYVQLKPKDDASVGRCLSLVRRQGLMLASSMWQCTSQTLKVVAVPTGRILPPLQLP